MAPNPYLPPERDEVAKSRRAKGLGLVLAVVEMAVGLAAFGVGVFATVDGMTSPPSPGSPMHGGAWIFGTLVGFQGVVLFLCGLMLFRRIVWPQIILAAPFVLGALGAIWQLIRAAV